MTYIMHYRDQDHPREVEEEEARALIDNNWPNPNMRILRWKDRQEGKQVHLRNGYIVRGDLN